MKTLTRLMVALCLVTLGACTGSDESTPATETMASSSSPAAGPTGDRISVPTRNWTHGPIQGNLEAKFIAVGRCAVIGAPGHYEIVIWPRGWYGRLWPSGEITIYTATDKPFATTGREVGLFGGWHPGHTDNPHPCAQRYSYRASYTTLLNRQSNTTPLP